ncbi:MAG: c-type cytochrome domain-containing protein, partial [Planctomycetota bacterium]|nr:c-type cytochrome domain-containing protein [Planctomycetota bacterium]
MLPIRLILLSSLVTGLVFTAFPQAQVESEKIRFGRDIRPILSDRCFQCHGRDPSTREEDLRLDLQEEATADRGGYAVIVPGNPGESELWLRVNSDDPDEFMPPT